VIRISKEAGNRGHVPLMLLLAFSVVAWPPASAAAGQLASSSVDQDDAGTVPPRRAEAPAPTVGHNVRSSVGEVGQRQTGTETMPGLKSTARIASRIESRVQSRIANRIDRNYNPDVRAPDVFAAASEQARVVPKN
jgi:hypothetical protein